MLTLLTTIPLLFAITHAPSLDPSEDPSTRSAYMPAKVAPAVFAIVLSINMAEIGTDMFFFRLIIERAAFSFAGSFFAASRRPIRVLYSADS